MSAHNNNNQRGYVRDDLHSTANKNLQSQLKARRELAPIQNPKKQAQSLIQKKLKAKDLGAPQTAEKTPDNFAKKRISAMKQSISGNSATITPSAIQPSSRSRAK